MSSSAGNIVDHSKSPHQKGVSTSSTTSNLITGSSGYNASSSALDDLNQHLKIP